MQKAHQMDADAASTTEALKHCQIPVLFVHGTDDHFVPVEMTYENYKACTSEKRLLIVPGADHCMSYLVGKSTYERIAKRVLGILRTAEKRIRRFEFEGGIIMRQRWLRVLFRRRMLTILLLLLQVYFLICLVLGGSQLSRNFSRLLTIVSIIAVLYIVSQKDKGAYKTAWAILILTFPLFGGLMYLLSNAQSSKWRFCKKCPPYTTKGKTTLCTPRHLL